MVSLSGTLSRVNTVASALKRFLSRDDGRPGSITPNEENPKYRFPGSASSNSLAPPAGTKPVGSMRITDQVIEEVDEQATITSQRTNDNRPNVRDIFAPNIGSTGSLGQQEKPPVPIDPTDGTPKHKLYMRTQSTVEPSLFPAGGVEALLNSSAHSASSQTMAHTVPNSPMAESTKSLFDRDQRNERGSRETGKFLFRNTELFLTYCVTRKINIF